MDTFAPRPVGREPTDVTPTWREALAGIGGAGRMVLSLLTPWNRARRRLRDAGPRLAARPDPGDDPVPDPRWGWTHAIEVAAPAGDHRGRPEVRSRTADIAQEIARPPDPVP
jgi:hypothetical protein